MTYKCPVCRVADEYAYINCDHPRCPDGHDYGLWPPSASSSSSKRRRRRAGFDQPAVQPHDVVTLGTATVAIIAGIALMILFVLMITPVRAMDHGFPPDAPLTRYMESLMQPPKGIISCCGAADAYPVDNYERHEDGSYTVWLANGDPIIYPDGTHRQPFDVNTPIQVPPEKVNELKDDLDNPSDHSWIFFRPSTDKSVAALYCFVRHPNDY